MKLTNSVILITGAGGGLGSEAALALAKQGANVLLLDKNMPALEKIYDRIVDEGGAEPLMCPFDLAGASEQQYMELAENIRLKFGVLHGILHAAAAFTAYMPITQHSTYDWGHILNVNLHSAFLLCRELLPLLAESDFAAIVLVSDASARQAAAYKGAYGVSKIALEGFAGILADELAAGQKIHVNTLVPGPIPTPIRKKAFPGDKPEALTDLGEFHPLFVYLFSVASRGLTGLTIDAPTFIREKPWLNEK